MRAHLPQRLLPVIAKQPFCDATRFGQLLTFDMNEKDRVDKLRRLFYRKQSNASPNRRPSAQRRGEANFIEAVIHSHPDARANLHCLAQQPRQERKSQKAVSDRAAKRCFTFGTRSVQMNPLVILGSIGEFLDALERHGLTGFSAGLRRRRCIALIAKGAAAG